MPQDVHDASYYFKCMIGGVLSCGLTHTGIVSLDMAKCRKQVYPELYPSIIGAFKKIRAEEGLRGLTLGWAPTLIGYSMQGLGKFGFYEIFKDLYGGMFTPENSLKYRKIIWAFASGSAEIIADVLLCPMEALKVRMQTSKPGTFPTDFGKGFNTIKDAEGLNGFYKGIAPLWCRQVPYTIVKFVAFEYIVEKMYKHVFNKKTKNEYSKATQLSVTFASGYMAGVFCAIVSHPADTMVSKLNAIKSKESIGQSISKIYGDIGFAGLWRGLGARIIMIGTLTGFQWWIYDTFKSAVGLQTSGGGGQQQSVASTPKKH